MAYKHGEYTLYTMQVAWGGKDKGNVQSKYFFSKKPLSKQKKGTPCDLPDGYTVVVNERTTLPFIKKA